EHGVAEGLVVDARDVHGDHFVYQGWIPVQAGHDHGFLGATEAQHDATLLFIERVKAHAAPDEERQDCADGEQAAGDVAATHRTAGAATGGLAASEETGNFADKVVQYLIDIGRSLVLVAGTAGTRAPGIVLAIVIVRFIPGHAALQLCVERLRRAVR